MWSYNAESLREKQSVNMSVCLYQDTFDWEMKSFWRNRNCLGDETRVSVTAKSNLIILDGENSILYFPDIW
jgi:hypothetical protein